MNKLKTILIDDEVDSIRVLELLLQKYCSNVEIVATASNVDQAISAISIYEPHLVFLDIEMPDKNGFELFSAIGNLTFHTIVVTGYEKYAVQAIKYAAIDYLLKPVSAQDLKDAVAKVDPVTLQNDPRTSHLFELLRSPIAAYDKLVISSQNGFRTLEMSQIICLKAMEGSYAIIQLEDAGRVLATKALTYFETVLPADTFCRVHRSHIVNLAHIVSFDNKTDELVLSNGEIVSVSARKRSVFRLNFSAFTRG
ncbi:MAG: two-component system LytT family response regulator [Bacteroidia bacterium]|jgi:two-component system LytT family response regulator